MEWLIRNTISSALLPPGLLLFLGLGGLAVVRRHAALGKTMIAFAFAVLYALSTRYVAHSLLHTLEPPPYVLPIDRRAQAIVVVGAGRYFNAPEYGADTVDAPALVRLRYAAHMYRATGKPILTSGGSPEGAPGSDAAQMKAVLNSDFQVPVAWVEGKSRTTLENARFAYKILSATGIRTIYLVTHAWHMPRAKLAFEAAGFTVIPAATGYATRFQLTLLDFLPNARALLDSNKFFHEVIGIVWYQLQFAVTRWK